MGWELNLVTKTEVMQSVSSKTSTDNCGLLPLLLDRASLLEFATRPIYELDTPAKLGFVSFRHEFENETHH